MTKLKDTQNIDEIGKLINQLNVRELSPVEMEGDVQFVEIDLKPNPDLYTKQRIILYNNKKPEDDGFSPPWKNMPSTYRKYRWKAPRNPPNIRKLQIQIK